MKQETSFALANGMARSSTVAPPGDIIHTNDIEMVGDICQSLWLVNGVLGLDRPHLPTWQRFHMVVSYGFRWKGLVLLQSKEIKILENYL